MIKDKYKNSGTVGGAIVLLIIVALIVLSIVRYFWVDTAIEHYDTLISAYIKEKEDYEPEDQSRLRKQLLESGMFIKIHRWERDSFIKDKELYNEIVKAYNRQEAIREEREGGLIDALINL